MAVEEPRRASTQHFEQTNHAMVTSSDVVAARPTKTARPRVAFVVQRAGVEIAGGAERLCLQVAQHMSQYWDVEILTTCARDYMEWRNCYPPGSETIDGVTVRRFSVDYPRDVASFNQLSIALRDRLSDTSRQEQEAWMRAQGPISTPLLNYLRDQFDNYDSFIFVGYLYATTYFGLPLVKEKSYLAPLAHDEWPIYFSMFDEMFSLPRAFIFNTEAERDFLRMRFPQLNLSGETIALGVERSTISHPEQFRARYDIPGPFILYVGRIDRSKGCDELVNYFVRARERGLIRHQLVLVGEEIMPVGFRDDIFSLGVLDEQEKWNALAACDWFAMPSPFESLSIALLEAWLAERPAIVNGRCAVLRHQCQQSNGGLWYETEMEWTSAIAFVDEDNKLQMGRQGRRYTEQYYSWDRVERDYLRFFQRYAPDAGPND